MALRVAYSHCRWPAILRTMYIQLTEMLAKSKLVRIFVNSSSNLFDLQISNGLTLQNLIQKVKMDDKISAIFKLFFDRLLSYFTEIYRILLMMLFSGCTVAILLTMLMIQIDLSQVISIR